MLKDLQHLESYLNNWLRYTTGNMRPVLNYGIGVSASAALQTLSGTLHELWLACHDVMEEHFIATLVGGVNQTINYNNHENDTQNDVGSPRWTQSLCSL